jgi:hypothetical protein
MEDNNAFDRQSPPIRKYFIDDLTGGQAFVIHLGLSGNDTTAGWAAIARLGSLRDHRYSGIYASLYAGSNSCA